MKRFDLLSLAAVGLALALPFLAAFGDVSVEAQSNNSIEGRVTGPSGNGVDSSIVTLLSDFYSELGRIYTDAGGRFQFRSLGPGTYIIKVNPVGTDLEPQQQTVEVNPFTGQRGGGEVFRVDFSLKARKVNELADWQVEVGPKVTFVQEIPAGAKSAFHDAESALGNNDLKGAEKALTKAVTIFPDYYEALDLLGTEYVKHSFYDAAAPILQHAVQVNKDGWHAYYGLGVALLELKRRDEGIKALRETLRLNPKSMNASMRLGLELAKSDRDAAEAITLIESVVKTVGHQYPNLYLLLASLESKLHRFGAAADSLESYLKNTDSPKQREEIKAKIKDLRAKEKTEKASS